jgi:hypothetical protein
MIFPILGIVLVAIDAYATLIRPSAQVTPNAVTIAMPILIAAGILKRPANERASILVLAAMFGVWLNRVVIPAQAVVHVIVLAGAVFLTLEGYRNDALKRGNLQGFTIIVGAVLGAFALVWLWQLR